MHVPGMFFGVNIFGTLLALDVHVRTHGCIWMGLGICMFSGYGFFQLKLFHSAFECGAN